jgi:purine-binding chemotaxis protein CheW
MKNELRTILKNRARVMAQEPEIEREGIEGTLVIAFDLAGETYGIESEFVKEIYPLKDFTPLPGVPSYISGIINVRGQILPVVDIKKFFNLPERGMGELKRVIILENEQMEFGIVADSVNDTFLIELRDILALPVTVSGIGSEYLKGVTKKNLIILDAQKLLNEKSIIVNEEV